MSTLCWLLVLNAVVGAAWTGVRYGEYRLKKKLITDIRDDDDIPELYMEFEPDEDDGDYDEYGEYNSDILSEDDFDMFDHLFDMGGKKPEGSGEPN